MDYRQSIEFLKERTKFGINMGLVRIEELLRRLDNPHRQGIRFVHVAGTNGKGSTAAMIASVCAAGGRETGFFSSPHLTSYCERFRINGREIKKEQLAELLTGIKPHLDAMADEGWEPPTEFEISTAMALLWFAAEGMDIAVMEVGLGGAIDSTNVIDAEIAVITSIAKDHMAYLGDTIPEIASVKAGIIKNGATVFTACHGEALRVIESTAKEKNAALYVLPDDFQTTFFENSDNGQGFVYCGFGRSYNDLILPLFGRHQISNAALAISVACKLGLAEEAIRQGLQSVKWAARLEILSREPLIVVDGAHNVEGMESLAAAVGDYWSDRSVTAILGMLADKERAEGLSKILPVIDFAVISRPDSDRAGDWQLLYDICREHGVPAIMEEDIKRACDVGLEKLKDNGMLLVSGSLYLVARAREYLLSVIGR